MRRAVPHLALAGLLGALVLVSWRTLVALDRAPDAGEAKLRAADRVIEYRVVRDCGPSFRLDGGPVRLKLVSSALVDGAYDAERVTSYGLRLTVRDGDRVLRQRDVYLQSRESKAGWDGARWRDEAAWGVDPVELADERIAIVELDDAPVDATLTVTLVGAPHEALLRVFREAPRDLGQRRAAAARLDAAARADLLRSSTYVPWPLLSEVEKEARLAHRWLRLAALGRAGVDFSTRTIFVTDFRVPFAAAATVEGIEVSRGHDAAINVRGPARLALTPAGAPLELEAIGAAGARPVAIGPGGVIAVGAEPVTLVVRTSAPDPIRFELSGPPDSLIAAVDARPPAPGALVPDHVRVPLAVTGPGTVVAARVRSVVGAPLLGRGLRVDARVVAPIVIDQPQVAMLWLTYRDADGRRLGGDRLIVGGAVSRFERLAFGAAVDVVTEPTSFRVIAPEGAARVELAADRDVALRLYRWLPGPETLEEPYRVVPVAEHRWRYARMIERSWFPMLPSNHDVLAATGRLAQLDAQVRLEPAVPARGARRPGVADYRSLVPLGHPEEQRAREPVGDDELAEILAAWPPGALTTLTPGAVRVIEVPVALAARPQLAWTADPGAVGGALEVTVDGARTTVPITSTRGAATLPRIAPGRHQVRVDGAVRELWIDRPPVDGARVVRDRTLYPLGPAGLRVRVRQRPGEEVHVYAVVYAATAATSPRTTLVMTVDGRRPVRRAGVSGRLTVGEVRVALPAARAHAPARLVDLGGKSAGLARAVGVGLLGDLVAGEHEIDLNEIGGGDVLWVRFVTTQRAAPSAGPATQWSSDAGPGLEVIDE